MQIGRRRRGHERQRRDQPGNAGADQDRGDGRTKPEPPLHQIAQHQRDADHQHARRRHQSRRHRNETGPVAGADSADIRDHPVGRPGWSGRTDRKNSEPSIQRRVSFVIVVRHSSSHFAKPGRPQLAGRTFAAAIAPIMALRPIAQIAAMGSPRRPTCSSPSPPISCASAKVAALSIHISGVCTTNSAVHAKGQRDLHRLDGVVAAIRIAGIVGFAHAGDEMLRPAPIGERRGKGEKDEVAARHERGRQAAIRHCDRDIAGQRSLRNLPERREVDHMIVAEARRPLRIERRAGARGWRAGPPVRPRAAGRNGSRWFRPARTGPAPSRGRRSESCPPENSTSASAVRRTCSEAFASNGPIAATRPSRQGARRAAPGPRSSCISASVRAKSKIAIFSASRSTLLVRGIAPTPCWISQRSETCARGLAMGLADAGEHGVALRAALGDRRIGHHRHVMGAAGRDHLGLVEKGMILELVADQAIARKPARFLDQRHRVVRHADIADEAVAFDSDQRIDGFLQRHALVRPMQQQKVDLAETQRGDRFLRPSAAAIPARDCRAQPW